MSVRLNQRVQPKSSSYTIVNPMDSPGTIFTNRDAVGAVTFTLPTPAVQLLGCWYEFRVVADQTVAVAGALCTLNNAAAASVTCSTSGQKIGAVMLAKCVETVSGTYKWHVNGSTVGVTYTVA